MIEDYERYERTRAIVEGMTHIKELVPADQIGYMQDLFRQRGTETFRDDDISVAFLQAQNGCAVRITGPIGSTLQFINLEIGGNCILYPVRMPTSPWVTELPKLERGEWFEILPGNWGERFKEGETVKLDLEIDGRPISAEFTAPSI